MKGKNVDVGDGMLSLLLVLSLIECSIDVPPAGKKDGMQAVVLSVRFFESVTWRSRSMIVCLQNTTRTSCASGSGDIVGAGAQNQLKKGDGDAIG